MEGDACEEYEKKETPVITWAERATNPIADSSLQNTAVNE